MGSSGSLIAVGLGVQGITSAIGAYSQSRATQAQGDYQKDVFDANSRMAERNAANALERGDLEASRIKKSARQLVGKQRASYAGQGVAVDSESAIDTYAQTDYMSSLDALTVKNNAYLEAFGYKTQALEYTSRGEYAQMAADNESRSTLLTGGLKFLGAGLQAGAYAFPGSNPNSNSPSVTTARRTPTSSYSSGFGGQKYF